MFQSRCTELHRQKRLIPATRKARTASEPSRKKEHHVLRLHLAFTRTSGKVSTWSISIWCAAQQRGREESIRTRSKFLTSLLPLVALVNKTKMSRICAAPRTSCVRYKLNHWPKNTHKQLRLKVGSWLWQIEYIKKKTLADIPRGPRSHNCRRWASRWPWWVGAPSMNQSIVYVVR
jgi:hypothetical protein